MARENFLRRNTRARFTESYAGAPPAVDLAAEKRLIALLVALAGEGTLQSAHDVSDGGLAVTLAESCFASDGLSAQVSLTSKEPDEAALFGERGARAVVSVTPENLAAVRRLRHNMKWQSWKLAESPAANSASN